MMWFTGQFRRRYGIEMFRREQRRGRPGSQGGRGAGSVLHVILPGIGRTVSSAGR